MTRNLLNTTILVFVTIFAAGFIFVIQQNHGVGVVIQRSGDGSTTKLSGNPLIEWWRKYNTTKDFGPIQKWKHYLDIYHRHLAKFRNEKFTMMEIGVSEGGSLKMWRDYFGPEVIIYEVDIQKAVLKFDNKEHVHILIGDQNNREFWKETMKTIPQLDLLIDDGGHTMEMLRTTFDCVYEHVNPNGGVFLLEDLHTAYWKKKYHGGYKKNTTFIEHTKNLIDELNAYHSHSKDLQVTDFTRSTQSIHVYDSVVIFEKFLHPTPVKLFAPPQKNFPTTI